MAKPKTETYAGFIKKHINIFLLYFVKYIFWTMKMFRDPVGGNRDEATDSVI